MAKWLSWGTRFWIILTLRGWAYGGWWTLTNLGLPPQTATAAEAYNFYVGTAPNEFPEYVRQCLADPAIEAGARGRYLSFQREWWALHVGSVTQVRRALAATPRGRTENVASDSFPTRA